MHLLLLADTHVATRAGDLPPQVWDEVAKADVVVHAGDWVDEELLNRLEASSRRLIGCYGNNDCAALRQRLPEVNETGLEGVRVTVVHDTGAAKGRGQRMDLRFPGSDLVVFGHSHIPWDTTSPGGIRLLNPGSPTDSRRQPHKTYMTVKLAAGQIGPVTLHRPP